MTPSCRRIIGIIKNVMPKLIECAIANVEFEVLNNLTIFFESIILKIDPGGDFSRE